MSQETKPTEIVIKTAPKFRPLQAVYITTFQFALIGCGVLADSTAMQWAGFVAMVMLAAAIAVTASERESALTIRQARERLDEIENEDTE